MLMLMFGANPRVQAGPDAPMDKAKTAVAAKMADYLEAESGLSRSADGAFEPAPGAHVYQLISGTAETGITVNISGVSEARQDALCNALRTRRHGVPTTVCFFGPAPAVSAAPVFYPSRLPSGNGDVTQTRAQPEPGKAATTSRLLRTVAL